MGAAADSRFRREDLQRLKEVKAVEDERLRSGVSVLLCERPSVASVDIRGGAPGTRETELLDPSCRVDQIDAICLSGGSAFGEVCETQRIRAGTKACSAASASAALCWRD